LPRPDQLQAFKRLCNLRINQCVEILGKPLEVTFDLGHYAHFDKPRGFGVTFIEPHRCHMRFAPKLAASPLHRADAIIRHELGHVVDHRIPKAELDAWARTRGFDLADTPEVRADDIAHAIWGTKLRYDRDTVQSTLHGKPTRPAHLGL